MEGVGELLDATLKRRLLCFFCGEVFWDIFQDELEGEKAEGSKGMRVDLPCPIEKCPLMVFKVTSVC